MSCKSCGSTFRRHGYESGTAKVKVANGSIYQLASYSDCERMYAGGRAHSNKTVIVVARNNGDHERLFTDDNRHEAAKYKRQLQRQGVPNNTARISAVMARDLCYDAVIELFEPAVMKEQIPSEAVK